MFKFSAEVDVSGRDNDRSAEVKPAGTIKGTL
jgi:hypothetical protein